MYCTCGTVSSGFEGRSRPWITMDHGIERASWACCYQSKKEERKGKPGGGRARMLFCLVVLRTVAQLSKSHKAFHREMLNGGLPFWCYERNVLRPRLSGQTLREMQNG